MTRGQAKSKVVVNLDTHAHFSEVDLDNSLQDASDEILVSTGCVEGVFELELVPNHIYYNLKETIPNYFHTVRIWSPVLKSFLVETDSRRLDRVKRDWELWRDNPQFWFPHSYERIAIVPAIREAGQKLTIFYKSTSQQLMHDGDTFNVPLEGQYLPELFGTADLLEQVQEYIKAQVYWEQYQKDLKKTLKLMNRALPDQVVKLEG